MAGFENIKKQYVSLVKAEQQKYETPNMQLTDKKPVLVEAFYNIDGNNSSVMAGFETVPSYISNNSAVRYNKILDVVMFGWSAESREKSDEPNVGFVYNQEGQSLIMSDTFVPIEGSFFRIYMDNQYFLYQVTSVSEVLDKDRPMYLITHDKVAHNQESRYTEIESQVTNTYKYIAENVGLPDKKVVIPIDNYNKLANITNIIKSLQMQYLKAFYDTKLAHTLVCRTIVDNEDVMYYSPYVIEFIKRTSCLKDDNRNINIVLTHETIALIEFQMQYHKSFFNSIVEDMDIVEDITETLMYITDYDSTCVFSFFNRIPNKKIKIITTETESMMKMIIADGSYEIIKVPNLSNTDASLLDRAIVNYKNISLLLEELKRYRVDPYSIHDYLKIPVVIFILKKYGLNDLVKKPYSDSILDILNI